MQTRPTVFILDEDVLTRTAVCDLASRANLLSEGFGSGLEFSEAYERSRPGCLVSELRLPDMNGWHVQSRLAAAGAAIPLVFLTAHASIRSAVRAIKGGAMYFFEKPAEKEELQEAIEQAVLADADRRRLYRHEEELAKRLALLSAKEEQVLDLIVEGKITREIAAEVGVSVRTVELRRAAIVRKLEMKSPMELVRFALSGATATARGKRD